MDEEEIKNNFYNVIGQGRIVKGKDNKNIYYGTTPFECGEDVVMMRESDLELIIKESIQGLLKTQREMPKELYNVNENPFFNDEIIYTTNEMIDYKLFLDRHIYSHNFKDMIFVRYENVDEGFCEEGNNGR